MTSLAVALKRMRHQGPVRVRPGQAVVGVEGHGKVCDREEVTGKHQDLPQEGGLGASEVQMLRAQD